MAATIEPPKLFGKEMVLQALPGKPLYVMSMHDDFYVSVWQQTDSDEWLGSVNGLALDPSMCASAQEVATAIEGHIKNLIEAFGPLASWQPAT